MRFEQQRKPYNFERLVILAFLLAGVAVAVYAGNDRFRAFLGHPGCTLNRLTGLLCPVCGGTRAVYHFLKGNFGLAWRYNPLIVLFTPPAVFCWCYLLYFFIRGFPLSRLSLPPVLIWALFAVVLLFGIARNIPHPLFEPLRLAPLL